MWKMIICEIEELVPVRWQHVVFALVAIETEVMLEGLIQRREFGFRDTRLAQQFVHRCGGAGGEELAARIAPGVFAAGIDE